MSTGLDRLDDLESAVTPGVLRQWLASEQWSLSVERQGVLEIWSSVAPLARGIDSVTVPTAEGLVDFNRRLKDSLDDLALAYDLRPTELVQRIISVRSDMFFVRLDQYSSDGTIPFKQAAALMGSIQRMVRAAATSASNPYHSHQGRRPAEVTEFLEDDLRFGHTKRGSFIITVAARLDATEAPTVSGKAGVATDEGATDEIVPFSRRVMRTLAVGLQETKRLSAHLDRDGALEADILELSAAGVSVELLQSVLEIGGAEGVRSIDVDFDWSPLGPEPPDVEHVTIESTDLEGVGRVKELLLREEPPTEETLIGRVGELARRDLGGGIEEYEVTLEAELDGRMRKVHVPLVQSDYEWAIYAHQQRLPFTVTGTPVKHRSWELTGIVTADLAFLEDHRSRASR